MTQYKISRLCLCTHCDICNIRLITTVIARSDDRNNLFHRAKERQEMKFHYRKQIIDHVSVFLLLVSSLLFFVWLRAADEPGYSSAFGRTVIYSIVSYRIVSYPSASVVMCCTAVAYETISVEVFSTDAQLQYES